MRACFGAYGHEGGDFLRSSDGIYGYAPFYRNRHYVGSTGNIPPYKRELSAGGSVPVPLRCLRTDSGVFGAEADRREDWRVAGRNIVCSVCGASSVWRVGDYQGAVVAGDYLRDLQVLVGEGKIEVNIRGFTGMRNSCYTVKVTIM